MKTGPKVSEKDSAKDNNVEKELFKNKNINTENVTQVFKEMNKDDEKPAILDGEFGSETHTW